VALPLGVSFSCQRGRGLTARRAAVQPLRRENKSRTNTWTQLVEKPDGQRVHLGADLWLARHHAGLFEPEPRMAIAPSPSSPWGFS
jgi:hypothetical protein